MFEYLSCFLAGLLAKLTDLQVDEKLFVYKNLQFFSGALYGAIAGFVASLSTPFATLILAITVGVLLGGKIDKRAHQFALAALFAVIAFYGLPAVNVSFLAVLLAAGAADEKLNDSFAGKKGFSGFVARRRLLTDAAAFALSAWSGEWAYFFGLACFDVAYQFAGVAGPRFFKELPGQKGSHLLLDLYDCSPRALDDFDLVYGVLKKAPKKAGMTALGEPHVVRVKEERDEGLTGFVFLKESHASIHTYPRFGNAHVDLFSCKPFDSRAVSKWLEKKFKATKAVARKVNRSEG